MSEREAVVAFLRMRNGDLTEEEATVLELYAQAIEDGDHLKVPANDAPEKDGPWNDPAF